jgi:hypothetical protein
MADLRERVARAIADEPDTWPEWLPEADAVLAELGPELQPQSIAEHGKRMYDRGFADGKAAAPQPQAARIAGPWTMDEHGSFRACNGKRVAFIEKTPRVLRDDGEWEYGDKGCGQLCGKDPDSRSWCDAKLVAMGYALSDAPQPQAEPVGEWVMVPREPTLAMLGAGRAKARDGYTLEAAWEAMLAAAPKRGGA